MTTKEYNNIVDLFADRLFRFALKDLNDTDMANDIVQESFTRLWENRSHLIKEKVKSYLFTIAYNLIMDHFRAKNKLSIIEEVEDKRQTPSNEGYTDLNEILEEAFFQLPPVQRSVVLLRDYEGYDYREISEITGLSETQVKVYIYRGRKQLKKYLVRIDNLV